MPASSRSRTNPTAVKVKIDNEIPTQLLRRWNTAMFCFHTALLGVTLAAGNLSLQVDVYTVKNKVSYRLLNDTTYYDYRPDGDVEWRIQPNVHLTDTLYITLATAGFFLISAVFHLCNATLWRNFYERQLRECRSPTRWAEYLLSAPLMFVLIAYGLGLRTRTEILTTAALVSATIPYGAWGESVARPESPDKWKDSLVTRALPWLLGHIPQTVAWFVVVDRYYGAGYENAPWFVTLILWGELILFYSFGLAVLAGLFLPPRLFWKQELAFQILSLVSKGFLGLLLITNVLMLQRFEDAFE